MGGCLCLRIDRGERTAVASRAVACGNWAACTRMAHDRRLESRSVSVAGIALRRRRNVRGILRQTRAARHVTG